jgi:uncharacterized protein YjbI with pentapeptide repeats
LLQNQVEAEKQKFNPTKKTIAKDWVQLFSGIVPFVTVIIAFLAWMDSNQKDAQQLERSQRATISELSEGLSNANAATRIANANGLAPFLQDPAFGTSVVSVLIGAILEEPELSVRGAMIRVITLDRTTALQKWLEIRPIAWSKLEEMRRRHNALTEKVGRTRLAMQDNMSPELKTELGANEAILLQLETRIAAVQHSVVALAQTTRDARAASECIKVDGCSHCRMTLEGFYLDDFDFFAVGYSLCNADFSSASLVSANFTGLNLTGSNFNGSTLREAHFRRTNLSGADFSNVDIASMREGLGFRPVATFVGADLSNVVFDKACLSGADFRDVRAGLTVEQMKAAFARGARFDSKVQDDMERADALKEGPKCQ